MGIRINRVYTRSGDKGQTALIGGDRVPKNHPRVHAYGDIDELNSALGLAKEQVSSTTKPLVDIIEYIQQELFDLGAELATPPEARWLGMWRAEAQHIASLEKLCDHFSYQLPELESFILPGGSKLAGALHLARAIARRAERSVVALDEDCRASKQEGVGDQAVAYINRLSDLLFILARWSLVQEGKDAPLWDQERERKLPD